MPRGISAKSEVTRQALLHAAMKEFAEKGYHATTTRGISERAGVASGLMYAYYKSKEAVLLAVLDMRTEMLQQQLKKLEPAEEASPLDRIKQMAEIWFEMMQRDSDYLRFRTALNLQPDIPESIRDSIRENSKKLFRHIAAPFKAANPEQGENNARVFMAILEGSAHQYLGVMRPFPLKKIKAIILNDICPTFI